MYSARKSVGQCHPVLLDELWRHVEGRLCQIAAGDACNASEKRGRIDVLRPRYESRIREDGLAVCCLLHAHITSRLQGTDAAVYRNELYLVQYAGGGGGLVQLRKRSMNHVLPMVSDTCWRVLYRREDDAIADAETAEELEAVIIDGTCECDIENGGGDPAAGEPEFPAVDFVDEGMLARFEAAFDHLCPPDARRRGRHGTVRLSPEMRYEYKRKLLRRIVRRGTMLEFAAESLSEEGQAAYGIDTDFGLSRDEAFVLAMDDAMHTERERASVVHMHLLQWLYPQPTREYPRIRRMKA